MPIMAEITEERRAQSTSRLILDELIQLLSEGTILHDLEYQTRLVWRLFQPLERAVGHAGFSCEYFGKFHETLGDDTEARLLELDDCFDRYRSALRREDVPGFYFEQPGGRSRAIETLKKLRDSTMRSGGFFIPYPAMGHGRRNTHLCTGR